MPCLRGLSGGSSRESCPLWALQGRQPLSAEWGRRGLNLLSQSEATASCCSVFLVVAKTSFTYFMDTDPLSHAPAPRRAGEQRAGGSRGQGPLLLGEAPPLASSRPPASGPRSADQPEGGRPGQPSPSQCKTDAAPKRAVPSMQPDVQEAELSTLGPCRAWHWACPELCRADSRRFIKRPAKNDKTNAGALVSQGCLNKTP